MKFLIYRTSGNRVTSSNLNISNRTQTYQRQYCGPFQRFEQFVEVNTLQDLLSLRTNFLSKYGGYSELILTFDKLSGNLAIEIYDDWRE